MKKSTENQLREDILTYEQQCDAGRAQSDDVRALKRQILRNLSRLGVEWDTPTLIRLGSQRYKKYAADYGIEL